MIHMLFLVTPGLDTVPQVIHHLKQHVLPLQCRMLVINIGKTFSEARVCKSDIYENGKRYNL